MSRMRDANVAPAFALKQATKLRRRALGQHAKLDNETAAKLDSKHALIDQETNKSGIIAWILEFFHYSMFTWVTPIIETSQRQPISTGHLLDIDDQFSAEFLTNELEYSYKVARQNSNRSPLIWALVAAHGFSISRAGVLFAIEQGLSLAQVVIVGNFLDGLTRTTPNRQLYAMAIILAFVTLCRNMLLHVHAMENWQCGLRMRAAVTGLIYRKALSKSCRMSAAQVLTMVTTDVEPLYSSWYLHSLWIAPIQALVAIYLGWQQIGSSILAGFCILLFLLPLQLYLGQYYAAVRAKSAEFTEHRICLTKSIFSSIKTIKMAATEDVFERDVQTAREEETSSITQASAVRAANIAVWSCLTSVCTCGSLLHHVLQGNELTRGKVLSTAAIFAALRLVYSHGLSTAVILIGQLRSSFQRIEALLKTVDASTEEATFHVSGSACLDNMLVNNLPAAVNCLSEIDPSVAFSVPLVTMHQANYEIKLPDGKSKQVLSQVSLRCQRGEEVAIIGPVGAGKTSILLAILGELELVGGICSVTCPTLYVPQRPWLTKGTVRTNILFGRPYDQAWYSKVLESCGLDRDCASFPDGDHTQVGERGAALSGGQQARLSLARAVYATKSVAQLNHGRCIVLLDDPFSALDPEVAVQVRECVIDGLLRSRGLGVVLATHHLKFTTSANVLISLESDGSVGRTVKNDRLQVVRTPPPSPPVGEHNIGEMKTTPTHVEVSNRKSHPVDTNGNISLSAVWMFALGGATFFTWIGCGILFIATQAALVGSDMFLSWWSNLPIETQQSSNIICSYICVVVVLVLVTVVRSIAFFSATLRCSTKLHCMAFHGVIRSPLQFFQSQSIGQILNRFSKDIATLDEHLPETLLDFLQMGIQTVSTTILVCSVDSSLMAVVIPAVIVFLSIRQKYIKPALEIKMLEATARSPVLSHVADSIDGRQVIVSFPSAVQENEKSFHEFLDNHTKAFNTFIVTSRWLGSRMDCILLVLITFTSLMAVYNRESTNPCTLGLGLSYILQLTGVFQWAVRQSAEVENQLLSVARLGSYRDLRREAEIVACGGPHSCQMCDGAKPGPRWPRSGSLMMENLSLRYSMDGKNALRGVTCKISAGQNVGVVGRTGAGKSSLVTAVLRLAITVGKVEIDGVPTCRIPLTKLRSAVTVIPQDPVLFDGTIRKNLDPLNRMTDQAIWDALVVVGLRSVIGGQSNGLDHIVSAEECNFSVGQRQLLCLARAVLNPTQLLILDEATAHTDSATDALIQKIIRTQFAQSTIITIAHRIDSIIDADIVFVMDDGRIVDSGRPRSLVDQEGGLFARCGAVVSG